MSRERSDERAAGILAFALATQLGVAIVLTGGRDEWAICEAAHRSMRFPAVNLAGTTSLGDLAALLARLHLFIANDSGPAHLAAAAGTPTVVIFGAARAEDWAPLGARRHRWLSVPVPCRPCTVSECAIGYRCLASVTVAAVPRRASALLAEDLGRSSSPAPRSDGPCSSYLTGRGDGEVAPCPP